MKYVNINSIAVVVCTLAFIACYSNGDKISAFIVAFLAVINAIIVTQQINKNK